MTFVPGVATPDVPRTDPYSDVLTRAEAVALRLIQAFPAGAPDDACQFVGDGCVRISASMVRGLFAACERARRLRR